MHESRESIQSEKLGWNRKFKPLLQYLNTSAKEKCHLILRSSLLTQLRFKNQT